MSDTQKRLHTLLTDRAIEGLDAQFEAELAHLLLESGLDEHDPSYEQAAAGIELALLPHDEPMPAALAALVLAQADDYWQVSPAPAPAEPGRPVSNTTQTGYMPADLRRETEAIGGVANWTGPQPRVTAAIEDQRGTEPAAGEDEQAKSKQRKRKREPEPSESLASSHGGVVRMRPPNRVANIAAYVSAVAAVVVLGVAIWLYFQQRKDSSEREFETIQAQLETAGDKLEWSFAAQADPAVGEGAGGSVVWSSDLQAGVMKLHGLAVNEPTAAQYQLWIIDETREGPPVDGGVFDVRSDDELDLAIDAKLLVGKPKAFAITVERPGGVVVSSQERVVLLAAQP